MRRGRVLPCAVAAVWATGAWAAKPVPLEVAVTTVSAAGAYLTVERLAGAEFAGRLTGTPGYMGAARWMAGELRVAGLAAPAGHPDYLQRFPVTVTGVESATMELLPADEKGETRRLEYFRDFLPLLYSGSGDVTAGVVFVGFGITAPGMGRDDYAGIDVAGKVVMAVRGAPKDGRDWLAYDSHRARTANARAHGAAGYLFAESAGANPNGAPIVDLPMADVSEEIGNAILAPSKLTLEELHAVLEKGGVASFLTGRKVHLAVKARPWYEGEGANVVAVLRGSDPGLAGEFVVVGAHLDHCGDWPALLPGADDNASGSATVLEIARAAARLRPRPARSLVFVLFAGEEEGLLGSKFFVEHVPQGLTRGAAVFNLDMEGVGRGAWVAGGKNFPELFALLERARDRLEPGLKLIAGRSEGEARSDHGPFQAAGIPAVSLFGASESHHGTHTPEDSIWFIAPANMQAIGRIVLDAAVRAADQR
ncbi:MAG TPA: M28 family peptidase [Thermoanaerobaculaceae bacterium]|nr:M28 family peptidase [Thermoanaerobaculaceae bacterium]